MGTWNETCALSNLPIRKGDKIVFFIIQEKERGYYYPVTLPLFGEYNQIGYVEKITRNADFVASFLGTAVVNLDENLHQLIKSFSNDTYVMMVHEEMYQSVLHEVGNRTPIGESACYQTALLNMVQASMHLPQVPQYPMVEKAKAHGLIDAAGIEKLVESEKQQIQTQNENLNTLSRYICSHLYPLKDMYMNMIKNKDADLARELVEIFMFDTALGYARKKWMPQAGAGSSSEENFIQSILAEKTLEHTRNHGYIIEDINI